MAYFTPEQWLLVALAAIIGLLLGLILASGGKWKRRYREEHARYEALERDHEARIRAANERIAELDRGDRSAISAGTGAALAGAAKGNDDLSAIRGIRPDDEITLNEMGFHRYKHIAKLSTEDQAAIEGRLGAEPGMIARENWIEQAEMLRKGDIDGHRRTYRASRS